MARSIDIIQGKLGHRANEVLVALKNGTIDTPEAIYSDVGKLHVLPYFWNSNSLAYEVTTGGSGAGSVTVTNFPSSQAVTGTFWQATQPVDNRRGLTPLFAAINASSSGDNTLVSADATKKIKVLQYTIVAAAAVNVTLKSGSTGITGAMPLAANGGVATPFVAPAHGHLVETAVNNALVMNLSAAVAVTGHLTYVLE